MERKYKYLGYVLIVLLPLLFVAFYKTYFIRFPDFNEDIKLFDHVHGAIALAWVLLLIVQPILISKKKNALHRKLGRLSYFVFTLLILSFVPQIIKIIRRGTMQDLFFPIADVSVLIPLYLLAIYYRKNVAKHMRYMIAAILVFFGPTVGRIGPLLLGWSPVFTQTIQYTLIYCILAGLIFYDGNLKKSRPYFVAIAFFIMHQLAFYAVFLW
jgi:hypothetical protein